MQKLLMKLIIFYALIFSVNILFPSVCLAEGKIIFLDKSIVFYEDGKEILPLDLALKYHELKWYNIDEYKDIARLKLEYVELNKENPILKEKIERLEERVTILNEQIDISKKITDLYKEGYETSLRNTTMKWYNEPILWFVIGFVASTSISIGLIKVYKGI